MFSQSFFGKNIITSTATIFMRGIVWKTFGKEKRKDLEKMCYADRQRLLRVAGAGIGPHDKIVWYFFSKTDDASLSPAYRKATVRKRKGMSSSFRSFRHDLVPGESELLAYYDVYVTSAASHLKVL